MRKLRGADRLKAWNTWRAFASRRRHLLWRAIARFRQRSVALALACWAENAQDRAEQLKLLALAVARLRRRGEMGAIRTWRGCAAKFWLNQARLRRADMRRVRNRHPDGPAATSGSEIFRNGFPVLTSASSVL